MIDAADREKIEASRNELHNLLDKPQLQGIPVSMVNFTLYDYNICSYIIKSLITEIPNNFNVAYIEIWLIR